MHTWPENFDFQTDPVCQDVFKPFIMDEMAKLKTYGQQRPADATYIFHEHAERVGENTARACRALGLDDVVAENMRWAVLPHDIGKRLLPAAIWDQEDKPDEDLKMRRRTHTTLGAQIAEEALGDIQHPFKDLMIDIMRHHHEQMDGRGPHKIPGAALSAPIRLAAIVEAYDGYRIWRPHFAERDISPAGVLAKMRQEKGETIYDMELFEIFAKMKMDDYKNGRLLQSETGKART